MPFRNEAFEKKARGAEGMRHVPAGATAAAVSSLPSLEAVDAAIAEQRRAHNGTLSTYTLVGTMASYLGVRVCACARVAVWGYAGAWLSMSVGN